LVQLAAGAWADREFPHPGPAWLGGRQGPLERVEIRREHQSVPLWGKAASRAKRAAPMGLRCGRRDPHRRRVAAQRRAAFPRRGKGLSPRFSLNSTRSSSAQSSSPVVVLEHSRDARTSSPVRATFQSPRALHIREVAGWCLYAQRGRGRAELSVGGRRSTGFPSL
jgi:hypothetical protein